MVHNIRITFGAHTQPQIEIQQGDYNSRTIRARCYTSSGVLMEFEGETVSVVYEISGKISEEYPVEVLENVLTFTMPGISSASAGSGKLQLRIYGEKSLLHSAIIPYTVKASLDPGPAEEDQVPMLVLLVQQAQQAIAECTAATDKANETVADIEQKLADGAFIGPTGYQGIGVTSASLDDQGELVFTVTDPATGGSSTLPPVNIDTSAAIQSVNQAAQEGVKQVQAAQASAIAAVEQAGKTQITAAQNAGTQAVGDVTDAKNAAITDIGTAQSGAEAAITAAQESAVQTVQKEQNTATEAISQAQQTSITAVENEGDAQVQRLKEIVPQPTADNNGMVVAVQSGAYQLENPAGLVLNDGVIASTSGWSSLQIANAMCPPFSVSGPIVQCTPVANYPLSVQVETTPTQEGAGDPSPENVRPIVGWDAVTIHQSNGDQDKTYAVQLGQTIYGGTVDAVTGVGAETWKCIVLDGAENWELSGNNILFYVYDLNYSISEEGLCSHLKYFVSVVGDGIYCIVIGTTMTVALGSVLSGQYTVDTWKSYLAAQYAAGTPVTIAYKLATPQPFQATGGQSIPALPGTNTIYTDADSLTVTGRADPIATITALQARVSALESAQTNM